MMAQLPPRHPAHICWLVLQCLVLGARSTDAPPDDLHAAIAATTSVYQALERVLDIPVAADLGPPSRRATEEVVNCSLFTTEATCPDRQCFWFVSSGSCGDPVPDCPSSGNITTCCSNMEEQAFDACREYDIFGEGAANCRWWRRVVKSSCLEHCANCTKVAQDVKDLACTFGLLGLGLDQVVIADFCEKTEQAFRNFRCPSACFVVDHPEWCQTQPALDCMEECGNYAPCRCRQPQGTAFGDPSFCVGTTIMEGEDVPGLAGITYSCAITPDSCMYHVPSGAACALFRHCPTDHCIVKQVTCERTEEDPLDQRECNDLGYCEKTTGFCFFDNRPFGHPCDDGLAWTENDVCEFGLCRGFVNYCTRDQVVCEPLDVCTTGGVCDNRTGRCRYDMLPDGTECDDERAYTVEDRCQNGLCAGRPVDLCAEGGVVCVAPDACHDAGTCNPRVGACSEAPAVTGRPCDDRDPRTANDTCIDGVCVGSHPGGEENARFLTRGSGECIDRDMRSMARYSGDVRDERECQEICRADHQCAAYYYAYPSCSIYGTIRIGPPLEREWAFEAASIPPAITIETTAPLKNGQRSGVCRTKGFVGDQEEKSEGARWNRDIVFHPVSLAAIFTVMLGLFFARPITRCFRRAMMPLPEELTGTAVQPYADTYEYEVQKAFKLSDKGVLKDAESPTALRIAAFPDELVKGAIVEARSPTGSKTAVASEIHIAEKAVPGVGVSADIVVGSPAKEPATPLTPPGVPDDPEEERAAGEGSIDVKSVGSQ